MSDAEARLAQLRKDYTPESDIGWLLQMVEDYKACSLKAIDLVQLYHDKLESAEAVILALEKCAAAASGPWSEK